MTVIVPRTVTVVGSERNRSAPLEESRSKRAYVLSGDPGAGKTKAFETEAEADSGRSRLVTARRFIERSLDNHPEWRGKTLFVDGLDEVRAGRPDARTPLDRIPAFPAPACNGDPR